MLKAPRRLCCEYIVNPLGVTAHPHLSWWVDDARAAEVQSAYEIEVATSVQAANDGIADLWQSGVVASSARAHVAYEGLPLGSGQAAWWRVRTFDSDGEASPWSTPATFEMGLLAESDWHGARWISGGISGSRHHAPPVTALRTDVQLADTPLRGRMYIGCYGQALPVVNDSPVDNAGDDLWTNYSHFYPCRVVDITSLLQTGRNSIGLLLADGHYAGAWPMTGRPREMFGQRAMAKVLIQIETASHQNLFWASDTSWRWSVSHCALSSWWGDTVDQRMAQTQLFDVSVPIQSWPFAQAVAPASEHAEPMFQLENPATTQRRIRPQREISRRALQTDSASPRVVVTHVFAHVLRGRLCVQVKGRVTDAVTLRYSLDGEHFDSEDRFTTVGDGGTEVLEAPLASHVFRYVQVEYGVRDTLLVQVVATTLQAPVEAEISFQSDHSTLNQWVTLMLTSRDVLAGSAPLAGAWDSTRLQDWGYGITWVPDLARLPGQVAKVRKWLDELRYAADQEIGPYAGTRLPVGRDTDGWARMEAMAATVMALFRAQDDLKSLQLCYATLRAAALAYRHQFPELIREQPRADLYGEGVEGSLVATAAAVRTLRLCAQLAGMLGEVADQERMQQAAEQVAAAFSKRFFSGDGHLVEVSTSALVAALAAGLLEGEAAQRHERLLCEEIRAQRYEVQLAPVLCRDLLPVLSGAGRLDVAYMVLLQTTPDSWLGGVMRGASVVEVQGQRDIAQVGALNWIFGELVGLDMSAELDTELNGFRAARIAPKPPLGAQFLAGSPVQKVQARLATASGEWAVAWEIDERSFVLDLTVPAGCHAAVELPDGVQQRVYSGDHRFVMEFSRGGDGLPTLLESVG